MIKSFQRNPVRYFMALLALLGAVVGANNVWHVIPDSVMRYVGFVAAVLAVWLGEVVRDMVTPVANPKTMWGETLVPLIPESQARKTDPPPPAGRRRYPDGN